MEWGNQTLEDDKETIRLFDELRAKGADWLGIVGSRKKELWENNLKFIKHIERTCELQKESREWVIYRILDPEEVSKLPTQR